MSKIISTTVVNLFNVMFLAIGSGIAVIIGHMLGAEKFQEARESAPQLIAFSTMLCVGLGIVMAILSPLFPMAYNTSEHVKKLATVFIIISAIFIVLAFGLLIHRKRSPFPRKGRLGSVVT